MSLSDENDGVLLSEVITLENDIVASTKDSSVWYQINTSDAMGGYLRIPQTPDPLNSNKKILKSGDVIISRLRPYLRQVAYVDIDSDAQLCASTEFYVLRARNNESIAFDMPNMIKLKRNILKNNIYDFNENNKANNFF